jgi:hypothetical protein
VGSQADVVHVQLDIPRDVWNRLARWATEHHIREAEAAVQIIEQQVGPSEGTSPTSFYADLIGRHLRGELEPGPHLVDIQVDESIAKAIRLELEKEYGIDDPVELVERMRNRE